MSLARLAGAITLTPLSETTVERGSVSSQLPPLSPARSTITGPAPYWRRPAGEEDWRQAPWDLRGRDDHVLLARVLGESLAYLLVLLVGRRPRVAALGLRVRDEVELQRTASERGDLLPTRRA